MISIKKYYWLLLILLITLTGCTNVAMTSAQALYNRRSLEKNFKDQYLTMKAFKAIKIDDDRFKNANIAIATYNEEMLIAGQVPEAWQRQAAEDIAKKIPDVKRVYNWVTIASPSSSLTKISDSWITAKVKAKLIASEDVDATRIKVVTENGTVFLMGIVQPDEANAAVDLASSTDGVEKVVKIFSYLKIYKA